MTDSNTLADNNIKGFDDSSRYVLSDHKVAHLGSISPDLWADCEKFDGNDNTYGKSDLKRKTVNNEEEKRRHTEAIKE